MCALRPRQTRACVWVWMRTYFSSLAARSLTLRPPFSCTSTPHVTDRDYWGSGVIILAPYHEVDIFRELALLIEAFDNKAVGDI